MTITDNSDNSDFNHMVNKKIDEDFMYVLNRLTTLFKQLDKSSIFYLSIFAIVIIIIFIQSVGFF